MLRFNWKICGGMLLSAALVSVSALQADQKAGKVRISDFGQNVSPVNYQGAVPESPPFAPPQINTPAPSQGSGSRFSIVPPAPAPAPSPAPAPAPAPTPSPAPFTPAPYAPAPYAPARLTTQGRAVVRPVVVRLVDVRLLLKHPAAQPADARLAVVQQVLVQRVTAVLPADTRADISNA